MSENVKTARDMNENRRCSKCGREIDPPALICRSCRRKKRNSEISQLPNREKVDMSAVVDTWGSPENLKWLEENCYKGNLPTMDQLPGWDQWVDSIRKHTHDFEKARRLSPRETISNVLGVKTKI